MALSSPPLAPAKFIGIQSGFGALPPIELYTLDAPVGIHPVGSSVSRQTLETHGFSVPPVAAEHTAGSAKR